MLSTLPVDPPQSLTHDPTYGGKFKQANLGPYRSGSDATRLIPLPANTPPVRTIFRLEAIRTKIIKQPEITIPDYRKCRRHTYRNQVL